MVKKNIDMLNLEMQQPEIGKQPFFSDAVSRKETDPRDQTAEEIVLETREIVNKNRLRGSRGKWENVVDYIELKDDGSGIFKPKRGEKMTVPRNEVNAGTFYLRERAAYLISRFLRFNVVPETVLREVDGEIGSFQKFIDGKTAEELHESEFRTKETLSERQKLWIFDLIIYNSDRHEANVMIKDRQFFGIDNSLSLANERLILFGSWWEVPIDSDIIEKIDRFLKWEKGLKTLRTYLEELISAREVDALFIRIERIGKILKRDGEISFMEARQAVLFN